MLAEVSRKQIVIASGNPGKIREFRQLFANSSFNIIPQSDFDVPDIEETGLSFMENALLKARNASRHTLRPAIADDSGIIVDALNGDPGVYSARYAGKGASDQENVQKLIDNVKTLPDDKRGAYFICVIIYVRYAEDPVPLITQGTWEGIAITEPKGTNGFGYDPIFYLPAHGCTSAELEPETKDRLSHRGQALRALIDNLSAESADLERDESSS